LKVELELELEFELEVELKLVSYASYAVSLLMAAGAYGVVTLCAQFTHDLLAIAKFLLLRQ